LAAKDRVVTCLSFMNCQIDITTSDILWQWKDAQNVT